MRHRYITHPGFQYSFMLSFVIGALFIVCVLGLSAWGTLLYTAKSLTLTEAQQVILRSGADRILNVLFVAAPILLALVGWFALYLSYRFVGPLSRLELWVEQCLLGGTPPPFISRKKDELSHVVELISSILKKRQRPR